MIWFSIIIAVIIVGTWLMVRRKAKNFAAQHPLTYAVDIPDACYTNVQMTEGGVTVRPHILVPPEVLAAIERGIAHTIRNTADQNWSQMRDLSKFQVFLVPPATHNVDDDPGSPALLVKKLDPNGVDIRTIQAAGTCIGVDGGLLYGPDPREPSIILPYEAGEEVNHLPYIEESARNEAEHLEMWENNRQMYANYTGANDQHPIFPDPAGS